MHKAISKTTWQEYLDAKAGLEREFDRFFAAVEEVKNELDDHAEGLSEGYLASDEGKKFVDWHEAWESFFSNAPELDTVLEDLPADEPESADETDDEVEEDE